MKKLLLQAVLITALLSLFFTGCSNGSDISYGTPDSIGVPSGTINNGTIPEFPITLPVNLPAGAQDVNIYRRRVDKLSHSGLEDWQRIAGTWIDSNDSEFDTDRTKDFTDNYSVIQNKCYEYKVEISIPSESRNIVKSLGFHLAGYYGWEEPELSTFPEITYEKTPDSNASLGYVTKLTLTNDSDEITYHNNETEQWHSYNLSYNWKVYPWLDSSNTTYTLSDDESLNLVYGNNNLTSFSLKIDFGDYFQYIKDYNVNVYGNDAEVDYDRVPLSLPGELIDFYYAMPLNPGSYTGPEPGIGMAIIPVNDTYQIFIERQNLNNSSSGWETVGFYDISIRPYKPYYSFMDYFYDSTDYAYRAKFILSDWTTEVIADVGTISPAGPGLTFMGFEDDYYLNYDEVDQEWYSDFENEPAPYVYYAYKSSYNYFDTYFTNDWSGYLVLEYTSQEDGGKYQMWPEFYILGNIKNKNYDVSFSPDMMPAYDEIPEDYESLTLDLTEFDIDIFVPNIDIARRFSFKGSYPYNVQNVSQIELNLD